MKRTLIFILLFAPAIMAAQSSLYSADDLYEMALENSRDLAQKEAEQRAASYRAREAASRRAPTVDFESTINYIGNPDTLTVEAGAFGELDLSAINPMLQPMPMPAEDTTFEMSGNTYYDFKLIVDQPIFTWGKIHNAHAASKEGAAAAAVSTEKTKEMLRTEILINCHVLHYLKEIELALSKQNELVRRLQNIASDNYENGMILRTEYLGALTSLRQSDLAAREIAQQIKEVELNISYLTGREMTAVMIGTDEFDIKEEESWEELYGGALSDNRDLVLLRHNMKAEEYKSRIQKGEFYFKPDLAFHMELSYSGSYFPLIQEGWQDEDKGNITLTLAIRTPLADFGGMYFAKEAAEADLEAARAAYENSREQIEKFIRQTLYDMETNRLNIDFYREQLETDREIIAQKEKEWLTGYGDERELLTEQITMYSHIIELNRELISLGSNHYQLENVTGRIKKNNNQL